MQVEFEHGFNRNHRKENNFQEEYLGLAIVDGKIKEAVNCRIYGTQSRNYCCIWFNNGDKWAAGSDYAGGYGYHRPSAAVQGALNAAGVTGFSPIDGRGDSAIELVILQLTKMLYPDSHCQVIKSHA